MYWLAYIFRCVENALFLVHADVLETKHDVKELPAIPFDQPLGNVTNNLSHAEGAHTETNTPYIIGDDTQALVLIETKVSNGKNILFKLFFALSTLHAQ